ncbi:MAG: hypothetical protein IKJ01_02290 [Lachnospiraceae bacterium]|nr:hypothetical protein [Lachnospiraceae bacterium]
MCYELWEHEIIDTYGEKIKLYKIVDVGTNYINEICVCKVSRESCKRTFNATKQSGVLEYVRGIRKITEITINVRKAHSFRCGLDSTFFLQKSILSAILFSTTEYRQLLEEKPF